MVVVAYKSFGHDVDDDMLTAFVARDKGSGMMAANICEQKGATDQLVVKQMVSNIDGWGHATIELKTDGEASHSASAGGDPKDAESSNYSSESTRIRPRVERRRRARGPGVYGSDACL